MFGVVVVVGLDIGVYGMLGCECLGNEVGGIE